MMKVRSFLCILLLFTLTFTLLVSCGGKDDQKHSSVHTLASTKRTTTKRATTAAVSHPDYAPSVDIHAKMEITAAEQTIEGIQCIEWIKEYNNAMMDFVYTHGSGIFDIFHNNHEKTVDDIPELRNTGDTLTVEYPYAEDLKQITAYRYENGELTDSDVKLGNDLENLLTLGKGEWYIALSYQTEGTFIEHRSEYEDYRYSYVFKWIVE